MRYIEIVYSLFFQFAQFITIESYDFQSMAIQKGQILNN